MLALAIAGISLVVILGLQVQPAAPDPREQLPDMRREFSALMQGLGEAPATPPGEMAKGDDVSIGASFTPKDRLAFTRALYRAATAEQYRAAGAARGEWVPEPDLMLFMCSGKAQGRVLRVTEAGMGVAVSLEAGARWSGKCTG